VLLIMAVFIFASLTWVFSASKWFTGPLPNIDESSASSLNGLDKEATIDTQEVLPAVSKAEP
jgi:hypothetical protein